MKVDAAPPEINERAREIAGTIQAALPGDVGFILFVFNYGPDGWMLHVSNAEREGAVAALEEFVRRERGKS